MPAMSLINIISPNASLCRTISEQLRPSGVWQISEFYTLSDAVSTWGDNLPQAIILDDAAIDRNISRMIEVAGLHATSQQTAPLLFMLGSSGDAIDVAIITESFPKPLRLGYLVARLQFHRHLQQLPPNVEFALGDWQFMPRKKQLANRENGKWVTLTDKESSLLECLRQSEKPISRDEILASIWGYSGDVDTHTLETHISSLRRKLVSDNDKGDLFIADQGCYRINPVWLINAKK